MESCEMCTQPGACCVIFPLFRGDIFNSAHLPRKTAREEAEQLLKENGLPFEVRAIEDIEGDPDYVRVSFGCSKLSKGGYCTIYDERPNTCRIFEPFKSGGCVMRPEETSQSRERRFEWLQWYREES